MKVIFVGYRKWASEILKNLKAAKSSDFSIIKIITNEAPEATFPDSIAIKPQELQSNTILEEIKNLQPDLILFYGWSWIVPEELYKNYLCIVLHPSPLPKYRGGSPIQHQIINGEKESAVTLFKMNEKVDGGLIYSQTPFSLDGSLEEIFERIVKVGTADTLKLIAGLINNTIKPYEQDDSRATYFKRRKPEESELTIDDLKNKTAEELYNFIRALSDPYPNAFVKDKEGKKLFLKVATLRS